MFVRLSSDHPISVLAVNQGLNIVSQLLSRNFSEELLVVNKVKHASAKGGLALSVKNGNIKDKPNFENRLARFRNIEMLYFLILAYHQG